ncbi:MAG: GerMN domain-containing protein [Thermosynechococcaceae cyanobacterium MS004]|nr:GerMN domain-containing protein [Thermosynechococcaceae cyanobacterium MS004]
MVNPRGSRAVIGLLFALTLGLGGCLESSNAPTSPSSPAISASPSDEPSPPVASDSPSPVAPISSKADVYWLSSSGTKLTLTPANIDLPKGDRPETQLSDALARLIQGPANADVTTSIPEETKLNSVKIERDGVHVDLSKAFTSGGGSTSMQARLGQVIYTASSLNPSDPVWISVDGEPLKVLGGEGLEVPQPITRSEFDKNYSL